MSGFAQKIIDWYNENKRDLPWRNLSDPYPIWLSEIILQQTRVDQGLPYFHKFFDKYPTVHLLANAEEQEVLRLWQGLGYYSRARNMHGAAKFISSELNGQFPDNFKDLKKLKGVGDYTAAAIASFAFNENVAVVDGNVYRVLSRRFGVEEDIASPKGKKIFQDLADSLLPQKKSDIYNQGIMEFGALHCKPKNPDCMFCVFSQECEARKTGKQTDLPIKIRKVKIKNRFFTYLVLEFKGRFAMKERLKGDIWQGLHDFPLLESENFYNEESLFDQTLISLKSLSRDVLRCESFGSYKHILTHQKIQAKFIHLNLKSENNLNKICEEYGLKLYSIEEIDKLPKPILINNFLKEHVF
ncbi:A/G-specific adenine glycosylase [Flexithrix dorotheae]|uniref:A/G-specific adenine glycosylase n=1 Tax=Flexithrix dorotheae TaxID=70993 RepID=UPI00035C15A1|nr:A/G-specific adenine glycosylase [Flexithrix dorotheae]